MKPKMRLSSLVRCLAPVCWAAAACGGATALKAQVPDPVVIQSVNVVDVDAGKVVQTQDVTAVGGRIISVEPSGSSPLPDGSTVVDGRGLYLAPGQ